MPDLTTDEALLEPPSDTPDIPDVTAPSIDPDSANIPAPQIEVKRLSVQEIAIKVTNADIDSYLSANSEDPTEVQAIKLELSETLKLDADNDSSVNMLLKMVTFDRVSGFYQRDLGKFYGIPVELFQSTVVFKPQIKIIFKEMFINPNDLPLRTYRLEKQLSFRIMNNIPTSEAELEILSDKLKTAFLGYKFTSSYEDTFTYRDKDSGYHFAIDATKETAIEIIKKIVEDVNEQIFDESLLRRTDINRPATVQKENILGVDTDMPLRGRYGELWLYEIEYHQKGIKPRKLIDKFNNGL